MSIFGNWRFTNKAPHVESDEIKKLSEKLDIEQKHRQEQAVQAKKANEQLQKEIAEAKKAEAKRIIQQKKNNQKVALIHLRVAERFQESLEQSSGARVSELKAIIDGRLEKAADLGFSVKGTVKGSITKAIQALS